MIHHATRPMKPIAPQKSVMELTAERIRAAILSGALPLGSKLSEQSLADTLGISRSPVREALALLQIEGLVRVLPKRGTFVFTPDGKVVQDLCEHRTVLECACLDLALQRRPAQLVAGLRKAMDKMQRAIAAGDWQGYSAGDMRFHHAIIDGGDNLSMARVYDTTLGPLTALRTHLFTAMNAQLDPSQVDRSMAEHAAILAACQADDAPQAQAVLSTHIRHLAETYNAALGRPRPQAAP